MKIQRSRQSAYLAVFALLFCSLALFAEDKDKDKDKPAEEKPAQYGVIEFGARYSWGNVDGRQDLLLGPGGPAATGNPSLAPGCLGCGTSLDPVLRFSKYGEYRDIRNGFFVRKLDATFDNLLNTKYYAILQSQKSIYRDQSYLATFGQYGKFKVQFRYDEIPHVYSDVTRTLFTKTATGVWSYPSAIRSTLQASTTANLPSLIAGTGTNAQQGVVTNSSLITPSILRKAGTFLASYDLSENLNINGSFFREAEDGYRPIGLIMNSSPSASATSGFGVELPETISYFNNLARMGAEYGKHDWAVQGAFVGSFFEQNIPSMTWDNPFLLTQPAGSAAISNPTTGRMTLYPNNQAYYINLAGAADLGKWVRLMASISPGWLRQDDSFLPYTTNGAITGCGGVTGAPCTTTASLPAPSLEGSKQTLAMNYTFVTLPWKQFQIKAMYRHYDYNNNTPVRTFTPTEGDAASPVVAGVENTPFGFNRKNFDLTGNWYFAKKSSAKIGYQAEWMDRSHRDVEHSLENTILGAVDVAYWKNLLFRLSYRHSSRKPDEYQDDNSSDPVTGAPITCTDPSVAFTADQRCSRRFDEAHRVRNRADGLIEYTPLGSLTLSAFGGTIQDDYNQRGDTNSPTALNFLTGSAATTNPYYLYGILKDISYNYGFGADYAFSPRLSFFAEYSHEHYYRRLISRNRTPTSGTQTILTCTGCDTANNDWESTTPEKVDIWTVGTDTNLNKKAYFSTYYSLSAGLANTLSRFLGDPTITTGPNAFVLVGTSAAVSYPESTARQHEVVAVFKYKLTNHLMPKFEFRYQQFDNKDFQTSPMSQYMGCASAATGTAVPGCPIRVVSSTTSPTPVLSPNAPISFYPYFQVVDNSSARYLFLGVDQPSYHAYYVSATLEFHF
ncbi:MAG TPA: MtrB/PioB family outer membrane beta-barrel protein [Terriglobales bacterium]|nr:MtrB/PioB family outer membrane beta-barrel protein [Terriglobales bacterium]